MTLEELEKSVRELEDLNEIQNMHREYVFWFNCQQWNEIIDCFAENAMTEMGPHGVQKGKEEIAGLFREVIAKSERYKGRHIVSQPVIDVEGDTARGYWVTYCFVDIPTAIPKLAVQVVNWEQGRYECEYVKEDGKWKFSYLKWIIPWPEPEKSVEKPQ